MGKNFYLIPLGFRTKMNKLHTKIQEIQTKIKSALEELEEFSDDEHIHECTSKIYRETKYIEALDWSEDPTVIHIGRRCFSKEGLQFIWNILPDKLPDLAAKMEIVSEDSDWLNNEYGIYSLDCFMEEIKYCKYDLSNAGKGIKFF